MYDSLLASAGLGILKRFHAGTGECTLSIRMFVRNASLILALLLTAGISTAQWKKVPLQEPSTINPNLYPANANAAKEIREGISAAAREHKRVLLVFGANWCIDCHVLERAFYQPRIEPLLHDNFVVVHVDVGQYDKNLDLAAKYHINLKKGVPSIAVLGGNGALITSSSELEKAHLLTEEDVIDFLNQWKAKKQAGNRSSHQRGFA